MIESNFSEIPDSKPAPSPVGASSSVPPNLGPMVSAELEAVRNDLEQAKTLADDYRWQLAGKSNECAELRQLLEKAQRDLIKLEGDINALRQDRHRLANQAMKAQEAERYAAENIKLRNEAESLRRALRALENAEYKPDKKHSSHNAEVIDIEYGL